MKFKHALACGLALACSSAFPVDARGFPVASQLLQAHNLERRMFGAAPLAWDARLAAAADAYAYELARTGRWGHSPAGQRVGQGENLWMGTRGAFAPREHDCRLGVGEARFPARRLPLRQP